MSFKFEFLTSWTSVSGSESNGLQSSSGTESEDDRDTSTSSSLTARSMSPDGSMNLCEDEVMKSISSSTNGIQDRILQDNFLGTFDVHLNNLVPPHPSRTTRILDHEHVGHLTDSYKENDFGQFVILVGMVREKIVDPAALKMEGAGEVEVLGGNHTREAMRSLYLKGALSYSTIKVNVYKPLPTTAALAIGYQHNTILHEKRRPMQFIEKVRLMRYCRPSDIMTKEEIIRWKDMLVVVFRIKDRRRLMNNFQQHLQMAKLPERLWKFVIQAVEKTGPVNEKLFRPLMRISSEEKVEECLQVLINFGQKAFKDKVKEVIDQGHVRSKQTKNKDKHTITCEETISQVEALDNQPGDDIDEEIIEQAEAETDAHYKHQYFSLKNEHEDLKNNFNKLLAENDRLTKELEKLKSETLDKGTECRGGTKRANESNLEEYTTGQMVEAYWPDDKEWLEARVLRVNKNGVRVQYTIDDGITTLPTKWLRPLESI